MANQEVHSREEDIKKLAGLIKDVKLCMLTTMDDDGELRSRPMAVQQFEFDGNLWFFTGKSTAKSGEIRHDARVNVSFADPGDHKFVSVTGRASLVEDKTKAKELWNPLYKTWFPKGLDDPELTLLKVDVSKAEYWDSPNGAIVYLLGAVKALATGQSAEVGEHEKVTL